VLGFTPTLGQSGVATMGIMSLNMGNLNLKVSNLKNRLAIEKKQKASGIGQKEGLSKGVQT
jgi:hypothetical protein